MTHAIESRDLAGFRILESVYPAGLRQPRHSHALASFSFVLAGTYLETFSARPATRQPSTIVFHPPQESHAVEYHLSPVRILSVHMNAQRFSHFTNHSDVFESHASGRTETTNWIGHRLYREFWQADDLSALAIEALVSEAVVEAARVHGRKANSSASWLKHAENFLHDNFSQPFHFGEVAKVAGVHPTHLARMFRQKHGCTVGEYVRRLRTDFAMNEMLNRNSSLAEIASAAGFSDQSHLTRTFKHRFGVTPSKYRRIHQR